MVQGGGVPSRHSEGPVSCAAPASLSSWLMSLPLVAHPVSRQIITKTQAIDRIDLSKALISRRQIVA